MVVDVVYQYTQHNTVQNNPDDRFSGALTAAHTKVGLTALHRSTNASKRDIKT